MAETAACKPKPFSYDYFCACREDPKKEFLYFFYAFCYRVGCGTIDFVAHLLILLTEFVRFIFEDLVWRNLKRFFIYIHSKTGGQIRENIDDQKKWFAEQNARLLAAKAALPAGRGGLAVADTAGALEVKSISRAVSRRKLRNAAAVVLPLLILAGVITGFAVFNSYSVALKVQYGGKDLGYIQNERVYDAAVEQLEDKIIGVDTRYNFAATPLYELAYVSKTSIEDAAGFSDALLQAVMGDEIQEAFGVFIDGEFVLAVNIDQQQTLLDFMDSLLSPYHSSVEGATIGFLKNITYETGMFPISKVWEYDAAAAFLGYVDTTTVKYTCLKGDTLADIAEQNGLTQEALLKYNPSLADTTITKGKKLTITVPKPYLQVRIAVRTTYTEDIPYDTIIKYTASYYEGYTEITTAGKNGTQRITADIVYVDGVEVSRDIIETEVTKEPRDQVKKVGTKTVPKTAPAISFKGVEVTGKFMWPVDGGYISCGWLGYSGHYGLDIAAPKGTNIYAADGGVVIEVAYWNYSYGYHIVIDHGNGYETRYAHCSKIYVKLGDVVKKGDVIAAVGETGKAYGNHLHFEIILDGQRVNPKKYITGD